MRNTNLKENIRSKSSKIDTTLRCDSQNAIHLAQNQAHHKRTKHIDVRLYFIREILDTKLLKLEKVAEAENATDVPWKNEGFLRIFKKNIF